MISSATVRKVSGLEFIAGRCKLCKSAMYKKPCPCWMRKKGFETCAKCVRCGYTVGLIRRRGER